MFNAVRCKFVVLPYELIMLYENIIQIEWTIKSTQLQGIKNIFSYACTLDNLHACAINFTPNDGVWMDLLFIWLPFFTNSHFYLNRHSLYSVTIVLVCALCDDKCLLNYAHFTQRNLIELQCDFKSKSWTRKNCWASTHVSPNIHRWGDFYRPSEINFCLFLYFSHSVLRWFKREATQMLINLQTHIYNATIYLLLVVFSFDQNTSTDI